jgi:hypothetical protein
LRNPGIGFLLANTKETGTQPIRLDARTGLTYQVRADHTRKKGKAQAPQLPLVEKGFVYYNGERYESPSLRIWSDCHEMSLLPGR